MTRQVSQRRVLRTTRHARRRFELVAAEYVERMGQRIRQRREELGLSRPDVARAMPGKTSENQIYRWEKGLHRASDDALEALAEILKVDVAYFYADNGRPGTPDLMASFNGNGEPSQLDRIEALLHQVLDRLGPDPGGEAETLSDELAGDEDSDVEAA